MPRRADQDQRRSEILSASCRLFERQGYRATTMDDVAEAVSLNKGTLYYYYDSKATILFELVMQAIGEPLERLRRYPADVAPDSFIERALRDTLRSASKSGALTAVYFQEYRFIDNHLSQEQLATLRAREAEYEGLLLNAFTAGMERGLFTARDPRVLLRVYLSMVSGIHRWFRDARRRRPHVEEDLVSTILDGFRSRPDA